MASESPSPSPLPEYREREANHSPCRFGRSVRRLGVLASAVALTGCAAAPPTPKQQLTAAYQDFYQRRYDQAFTRAEAFLRQYPAGPGSSEAVYLEGRVDEARAEAAGANDERAEVRLQLTAAANAYLRAMTLKPPPCVEGLAHAGFANAAYHLNDFPTAAREYAASYALLAAPDVKAWILFRIGVCQQRLGHFDMADGTFAKIRQDYPTQEPAALAAAQIGQRGYYLQVAAYASPSNAARAVARLRDENLPAARNSDPATTRQVVRVGPFPTFAEAQLAQARLSRDYPAARVVP